MKRFSLQGLSGIGMLLFFTPSVWAAATIEMGSGSKLDIGFRVQPEFYQTERDTDGNGSLETVTDFTLRRAQILLDGQFNDTVGLHLETDMTEDAASAGQGSAMRLIEAYTTIKFDEKFSVLMGQQLAPGIRPTMTDVGTQMTIDYPSLSYKSLTWGSRSTYAFGYSDYADSAAGWDGPVHNRDMGVTLFGLGPVDDQTTVKYYLGIYDGIRADAENSERFAARVQFNAGDPEPDFLNGGTYSGKKQTLAVGFFADTQAGVARDTVSQELVDYLLYGFDVFNEYSVGQQSIVTIEGGMLWLDLDDAVNPLVSGKAPAPQVQGDGYYAQVGYAMDSTQPWVLYEQWKSDADNDKGNSNTLQFGINFLLTKLDAKLQLAYEVFKTKTPIANTSEQKIKSLLVGVHITY